MPRAGQWWPVRGTGPLADGVCEAIIRQVPPIDKRGSSLLSAIGVDGERRPPCHPADPL